MIGLVIVGGMDAYRCRVAKHPLDAVVALPGSKSITNRALVVASLADGTSLLTDVLLADDTRLMIDALSALGIRITIDESACAAEVTGCRGFLPAEHADLHCGNSGTTMRFCAALVALGHGEFRLDGSPRLRERPIGALADVLGALGTGVEYHGEPGYPPLTIRAASISGGRVEFHDAPSSQLISGLLLAAPYATGDVLIDVTGGVTSAPYLTMTTAIMDRFGVTVLEQYERDGAKFIVAAPQRYQSARLVIEPDASNAGYFLAAAAIAGGRVTVTGLGTASVQGDARFVDVLERMGCRVEREANRLTVARAPGEERLTGVDVNLNDMPDCAQTLAVAALFAEGPTTIREVGNLRIKETDRLGALTCELTKLGARVEERTDGLTIHPPPRITPAAIDTYDDHRMAMSFALAGLTQPGVVINDPDCCGKTFPDFFERFERMIGT